MILPNGLLSYQIMKGHQNSSSYIQILKSYAIPIMKINYEELLTFQHDNCPIHVSRQTQNYLDNSDITILKWPPYSPDRNIIESISAELSNMVYNGPEIKNLSELRRRIDASVNTFNNMKKQYVDNLYKSMLSRLLAVITKNADRIKY